MANLKVSEFARAVGVSDATAWRWKKNGLVAHIKLGRSVRIPDSEIKRLMAENIVPASRQLRAR